jgi:CxxC-x17-CxxC domain-containing protein
MHKATCADCGKSCEVPFRPSGDKPVFCSECFGSKREAGDRGDRKEFNREPRREFNSRPTSSNSGQEELKKQLAEVNTKLDKLIGVVEKLLESKKEGAAGVGSSETKIKTKSEPKKTLKAVVKKALKK